MRKQRTFDAAAIFDDDAFRRRYGFHKADVFFYNHHAAHGLPAYFYSQFADALIYTADGIGDNVSYSVTAARGGTLDVLSGGDAALHRPFRINSVGLLYCYFTDALGFIWNRHEGKVTGLAGFGKPTAAGEIMRHFSGRRGRRDRVGFRELSRHASICPRRLRPPLARGRGSVSAGGDRAPDLRRGRKILAPHRPGGDRDVWRDLRQCPAQSRSPRNHVGQAGLRVSGHGRRRPAGRRLPDLSAHTRRRRKHGSTTVTTCVSSILAATTVPNSTRRPAHCPGLQRTASVRSTRRSNCWRRARW